MGGNKLNNETFLEFALEILSKEYAGESKRELVTNIKDILGTRKIVLAESFYQIILMLKLDIDSVCEILFKEHKVVVLNLVQESDNKLKDFLTPFIYDSSIIASSACIENTRFSRLLKGEFVKLYPSEVYGIAKSFNLMPHQLFHYFYGQGERPLIGV
ncbi:hypothetical protein I215_09451 [Galbibacter marinus]|uniref:Uncharacterized protein n=1 Tax=Galbibacter marinus TaxID=555500 RepID=K2QK33_9FLAO|nr:hypothetical protein [Galbibacter marinus]EKF55077.1 hypothetical protein I215_09451 [Galbibacter marinus]